jgi:hypothetical protein
VQNAELLKARTYGTDGTLGFDGFNFTNFSCKICKIKYNRTNLNSFTNVFFGAEN